MSKVCQISGKKVQFGNNVSKAINKTRRRFDANIISKKFYIPEEDKWIKLKVSTSVLKTINKKGISAVLKEAKEKGIKNNFCDPLILNFRTENYIKLKTALWLYLNYMDIRSVYV